MTSTLKTIVIGTSLADGSDGIVRIGVMLARMTGASPWLVHAYSPLMFEYGTGLEAEWLEQQARDLRKLLAEQAERTGLSALAAFSPGQLCLRVGPPHLRIVELAQRAQADLVVVGAAESRHGILGSTADRVIRKALCPVLAVRSAEAFPPTRVEIPVDLSPISAHALRQGLDFLRQTGVSLADAEALFVLNPFEVGGSIQFTPEQIQRFAGEELSRFVTASTPEGKRLGSMRVRTGYTREEILAALRERKADLVVLGTHGRGGFERLMIGSVAAGVLRDATCNLLVVPPAASQPDGDAARRGDGRVDADWSYVSDETPATAETTSTGR